MKEQITYGKNSTSIPNLHYFRDILDKKLKEDAFLRFEFKFIAASYILTPLLAALGLGLFDLLLLYELSYYCIPIGPLALIIPSDLYATLLSIGVCFFILEFPLLFFSPVLEIRVGRVDTLICWSTFMALTIVPLFWFALCCLDPDKLQAEMIEGSKKKSKRFCDYLEKKRSGQVKNEWYIWAEGTKNTDFNALGDEDIIKHFEKVGFFKLDEQFLSLIFIREFSIRRKASSIVKFLKLKKTPTR